MAFAVPYFDANCWPAVENSAATLIELNPYRLLNSINLVPFMFIPYPNMRVPFTIYDFGYRLLHCVNQGQGHSCIYVDPNACQYLKHVYAISKWVRNTHNGFGLIIMCIVQTQDEGILPFMFRPTLFQTLICFTSSSNKSASQLIRLRQLYNARPDGGHTCMRVLPVTKSYMFSYPNWRVSFTMTLDKDYFNTYTGTFWYSLHVLPQ